jgi:hypothetical protein
MADRTRQVLIQEVCEVYGGGADLKSVLVEWAGAVVQEWADSRRWPRGIQGGHVVFTMSWHADDAPPTRGPAAE